MSKNIPPAKGYNLDANIVDLISGDEETVKHFLETVGFGDETNIYDHRYMIGSAFDSPLNNMINKDACGTDEQIGSVMESIVRFVELNKNERNTYNALEVLPLAQMINSLRLDCANCLNGDCERRDPTHPASEVLKRVPEKK